MRLALPCGVLLVHPRDPTAAQEPPLAATAQSCTASTGAYRNPKSEVLLLHSRKVEKLSVEPLLIGTIRI